jgi:hypothetical protein
MTWRALLACGHEAAGLGAGPLRPGRPRPAYVTCTDPACQGQRRVTRTEPEDAIADRSEDTGNA